ncbi:MAG: hypothetical protein H7836_05475 [Magnetococcus sp. YQC-3]
MKKQMKKLKIALLAGVALLFAYVPLHLHAAALGQWSAGGFTQWHSSEGRTPLGSVGTQCYFCKPDGAAPAAPTASAPAKAAAPAVAAPAYEPQAIKKSGTQTTMKKATKKKATKKKAIKKKAKKKAVKKKAAKKQAVSQNPATMR